MTNLKQAFADKTYGQNNELLFVKIAEPFSKTSHADMWPGLAMTHFLEAAITLSNHGDKRIKGWLENYPGLEAAITRTIAQAVDRNAKPGKVAEAAFMTLMTFQHP